MKKWYQSKTLWFNVLVAVGTAIEASLSLVQGYFDPRVFLAIIGVTSGVNVLLRFISTTAITK
jgi:hypothetical protein